MGTFEDEQADNFLSLVRINNPANSFAFHHFYKYDALQGLVSDNSGSGTTRTGFVITNSGSGWRNLNEVAKNPVPVFASSKCNPVVAYQENY